MKRLNDQRGFTLIELVMVIVVLGILAVVAVPRYVSLSSDATAGANLGYIGALRSGISIRFSEESLRGVAAVDVITAAGPAVPATTATNLETMVTNPRPVGLTQAAASAVTCSAGTAVKGWTGLSTTIAGGAPATQQWDICPGTVVGNPIQILCSSATQTC
jgi:prepilin-type N-terminal cleavage/methylation domain-containing protein